MFALDPGFRKFLLINLCLCLPAAAYCQLTMTILHSFTGGLDGQQPYAGLVQAADGSLYGTTDYGGTNGAGVVFRVNPDGSGNSPVFDFGRNSIDPGGAANPSGLMEGTDGGFYGTTGFGGSAGLGTVFRVSADGSGFADLHDFSRDSGGPYEPVAGLVESSDGFLYGTTQGGGVSQLGCAFKVSTNGTGFVLLHQFGGTDGSNPESPLILGQDGALYGTTDTGGASAVGGVSGMGTIFKISTDGTTQTVLHSFVGTNGDGQYPLTAGVVQGSDGTLYGVTQQGGSTADGPNSGLGTVFKLNPDGSGFAVLHNFSGPPTDGDYPSATLVLGSDGFLYGTTEFGGFSNSGVVFQIATDGGGYRVLYHFGSGTNDGEYPATSFVQARDGGLFGMTKFGGANNFGTVFRLAPSPPVISGLVPLPDKSIQLSVTAASNFVFRIEATSDHAHWTTLTNVMNTTGTVRFTDASAAGAPMRFYRAAWVP